MNIANNNAINFESSVMVQKLQEGLTKADSDNNGSLSKSEVAANAPKGTNQSKIDQMFQRLDTDASGEISAEEQQAMIEQLSERMSGLPEGAGKGGAFGSFLTLMEQSAETGEELEFVAQLKANANNKNNEQGLATTLKDFTQKYPRVDLQA